MAIRSPVLFHNFWGAFADATLLPNTAGAPLSANEFKLEAGDFAYVVAGTTFYICTSQGGVNATPAATWIALSTGGGGSEDRFAPKYLVGSPSDTASALSGTGGFWFIPDPGDGTGIEYALTQPDGPGDVWIRPGTYDLGGGTVPVPLAIPPNTRVQGAGIGTTIIRSKGKDQSQAVFTMGAACQLRDMQIETPADNPATAGGLGTALVAVKGPECVLENLLILFQATNEGTLRYGIEVNTAGGSPVPLTSVENVNISADVLPDPNPLVPVALFRLAEGEVSARNLSGNGGDIGIELANQDGSLACVFFGQDVLLITPRQYGLHYYETGTVGAGAARITTGVVAGAGAGVGARIQGGALHVLRNCYMVGLDTGVLVDPPATRSASGQIASSLITTNTIGVDVGGGGGAVTRLVVADCEITSLDFGVRVRGIAPGTTAGVSVTSNTINTSGLTGSSPIYIDAANNTVPSGNVINQTDALVGVSTAIGIVNAPHCTCTDNLVVSNGAAGIGFDSASIYATLSGNDVTMTEATAAACYLISPPRAVVQGNIANVNAGGASACVGIDLTATATFTTVVANTVEVETGVGISIAGDKNTCNANTMGVDTTPVAAVVVSGDNNVVIGNFCGTTPPVTNTGAGNEVAHNI